MRLRHVNYRSQKTAAETTLVHIHHLRRIPVLSARWRGQPAPWHVRQFTRLRLTTTPSSYHIWRCSTHRHASVGSDRSTARSVLWLGGENTSPASSDKICAAPPVGKHFPILSTSESHPFSHRASTLDGSRSRESERAASHKKSRRYANGLVHGAGDLSLIHI